MIRLTQGLKERTESRLLKFGIRDLPWFSATWWNEHCAFFEHPNGAVFFAPWSEGDGPDAVSLGDIVHGRWEPREWHKMGTPEAKAIIRHAKKSLRSRRMERKK